MVRSQAIGGRVDPRILGEVCGEALSRGGLVQVVDLLEAGLRELLDQGGGVDAVGDEPDPPQPAAHAPERGEVRRDDLVDARAAAP